MNLSRIVPAFVLLAMAFHDPVSAILVRDHQNASTQGDLWDPQNAGYVTDVLVHLRKNVPVVFSTSALSPGGDPILHLLGPGASANGAVQELARADDSGGSLNASLTFTPPQDGDYRLILHATSSLGQGTCTLLQNNQPLLTNILFGAAMREYDNLRKGETMTMVLMPNGLADSQALYFFDDHGAIVRRHLPLPGSGSVSFALDRDYPVLYALAAKSAPIAPTGAVRVVRNDAPLSGHDSDKDGLGNELEGSIGTCSSASDIVGNWDCTRSTDLRDTDGDGISDADELLGRMDLTPPLRLPLWGADPRHKDIFIEVDYTLPSAGAPDSRMAPDAARAMAAGYGETNVVPTPFDATLHAQLLNNPDGLPGVHLHLDTGVAPLGPPDATIYGDWGGHNAVPPKTKAADAYATFMNPVRRGYFHYTNSYLGGGGQCGFGIACSWSQDVPHTAIHEFGHTLGLNHFGPSAGPHDANCKVSYPSAMSYAPPPVDVFSDGYGRPTYNNTSLREIGAVPDPTLPRSQALLQRLRDQYNYLVDIAAGNVDWNRDGTYQTGTISAYSNSFARSECELTSANQITLNQNISFNTPAVARLLDQVYIFYLDISGQLQLLQSSADPFHCPPTSDPGCGNTQFTSFTIAQPWNHGIVSVAVLNQVEDGVPKLLLMFTDGSGALWQTKLLQFANGQPLFSPVLSIRTAQPVSEEISMTGPSDHAWLAYKDSAGSIWLKRRINGQWDTDVLAHKPPGPSLLPVPPGSSPAIYEAPDLTLYGAFPQNDGSLPVLIHNSVSGEWSVDSRLHNNIGSSFGKAAMAWRAMPPGSPLPGRLYLYWFPRVGGNPGALWENWQTRTSAGVVSLDYSMYHSNEWYSGHGVAALYDPEVDDNIRLVVPVVDTNLDNVTPNGALQVRPKADGLADVDQPDRDDWEAMGTGLCNTLAAEQSGDPILCPP